MIEPDGQVLFSDYAELTEGLRDGVMRGIRTDRAQDPGEPEPPRAHPEARKRQAEMMTKRWAERRKAKAKAKK